jgi:hypothetical protein
MHTIAPKPSRLRLQFGLRTALVLMTVAAVGVALWTRWPYAVDEKVAQKLWREGAVNPLTNRSAQVIATHESAYYRRLLGGDRLRHGASRLFVSDQPGARKLLVERHFREGVLHGEYREFYTSGAPRCSGEYNRGRKHGPWLLLGQPEREQANSDYRRTQNWNFGVPHGTWQWEDGYRTVYLRVTYNQGRVKTIDGESVVDWLEEICRHLPGGRIADRWRVFHRHQANGGYPEWMQDPLERWPSLDLEIDPRLPVLPADRSVQVVRSVPYAVSLASDLHRTGRAATRRFNVLYITDPQHLGPEHDQTGVSVLAPQPGSRVATLFENNVKLRGNEFHFNFRQALRYMEDSVGLPVDDSLLTGTLNPRDEDRAWIPLGSNGDEHNVRDLLGLALHRARCKCELVKDVLVITRQ